MNSKYKFGQIVLIPFLLIITSICITINLPAVGKTTCKAPDSVCAASSRVFRISSFDPLASAVAIGPNLFITNRHAVADEKKLIIFIPDQGPVEATIIPTSYSGDLILFQTDNLETPPPLTLAQANLKDSYYTIGADIRSRKIKVYKPGYLLIPLAIKKPLARLHNNAYSQPGNSGGALVNAKGQLIAIVSSGGNGRNEAIPASEIKKLKSLSGSENEIKSQKLGIAYRNCIEALESFSPTSKQPPPQTITTLKVQCQKTNNRQLWDLAGQTFGRIGQYKQALKMFTSALEQDPNAINSLISIAIVHHLNGHYADEADYLRRLIEILPSDAGVLRLGIQAGAWGNDRSLMEKSLNLLETHHPNLAPMARSFIKKNPTPPKRP